MLALLVTLAFELLILLELLIASCLFEFLASAFLLSAAGVFELLLVRLAFELLTLLELLIASSLFELLASAFLLNATRV